MSLATNGKVTMALTPEEALAISTYLQAKAQYLLSKGGFIGVRGSTTSTKAVKAKAARAGAAKAGRKPEAEAGAKGGEAGATPKETKEATPEGVGEEEDIGLEEE